MDINEAKKMVIKAGLKLVESRLIVRTWGNVSCRMDNDSFVITPSGRDYLTLTPNEIVEVKIDDCSYAGVVVPSSEKGIHAEIYKHYPDINFIIHTHQENASIISTTDLDSIEIDEGYPHIGEKIVCAAYALPGSNMLKKNIIEALNRLNSKAVIMKNHGAICLGKDYNEAFSIAFDLEKACHEYILKRYYKISGRNYFNKEEMNDFALSLHHEKRKFKTSCWRKYPNSKRVKEGFLLYYDNEDEGIEIRSTDHVLMEEAILNYAIYNNHKEINHIVFNNSPAVKAICDYEIELEPYLDDFAQIVGVIVKNIENDAIKISKALEDASAVFIRDRGVVCCGRTKEDAIAVSMIVEKNCKAYICASLFEKAKPIDLDESLLMRRNYIERYSKLKNKN